MKKLIFILALIISNLTLAQIGKNADTLEIWTFSIGKFVDLNAERIIEKDWPFKIRAVAGDVVFGGEIQRVSVNNNKVWDYLDKNGYSDSEKKFKSDLLAEKTRITKAIKISNAYNIVSELYNKLKKNNLQNYTELKKINNNNYEFTIYSYDVENINKEQIFKLKFVSDLINEKVIILD